MQIRKSFYGKVKTTIGGYKISEWHPRLGGGVIADAILDRIVHNSEIISLGSKNMREFYSSQPLFQ